MMEVVQVGYNIFFDYHSKILKEIPVAPPTTVCDISGLPAKYVDPKTGTPYSTIEAFKIIRERFLQKEEAKYDQRISQLTALLEETKKKKTITHLQPDSAKNEIHSEG